MWDKITFPFPNFSGAAVEVWEWKSNFILHFTGHVVTYHHGDVIMGAIASQITSLMIVYSTIYSDVDQRKHQSFALLAFVRGIHRGPVNSPHKWPVTRKMFPFDDVFMYMLELKLIHVNNMPHRSVRCSCQCLRWISPGVCWNYNWQFRYPVLLGVQSLKV